MDQRRDDQLSTTEMAAGPEASVAESAPRSSWLHPMEQKTATAETDHPAGPPAPPADAGPTVEPRSELEEPVESPDHESSKPDRSQEGAAAEGTVELMAVDSRTRYRARWGDIQTGFVDDPAQAVREADHLVADVMEHLATTFAEERERLEERWSQGNEDTEHLRMALRRYRQFFGLLLME
jgi:hypothetical protein